MAVHRPGRTPLSPAELAEAAILADVAVLSLLLGRVTTLTFAAQVVAAVSFGVLAARRRVRAVVMGGLVALILTFLLAGFGTATSVIVCVAFGGVAGRAAAAGWGLARAMAMSLAVAWTLVAALTVGALAVLSGLRETTLASARAQWDGTAELLRGMGVDELADQGDRSVGWVIDHWYLSVPAFQLVLSAFLSLLAVRLTEPVVRRVRTALGEVDGEVAALDDSMAVVPRTAGDGRAGDGRTGEPVVSLSGVELVRNHRRLLGRLDLEVRAGEVLLVSGPNGAGKSTLLELLAGRRPVTSGSISRLDELTLGRPGGIAWVGQRPETQVVGTRVVDDLCWGLDQPPSDERIVEVLAAVGLPGWQERSTAGCSGGELQRIAIAAALVRRPRLLLSDESTAMIDPEGRERVRRALRSAAAAGTAVVHVSHLDEDRSMADRQVRLG